MKMSHHISMVSQVLLLLLLKIVFTINTACEVYHDMVYFAAFVYHVPTFLESFKFIHDLGTQRLEKKNHQHQSLYHRGTSKGGGRYKTKFAMQVNINWTTPYFYFNISMTYFVIILFFSSDYAIWKQERILQNTSSETREKKVHEKRATYCCTFVRQRQWR